MTGYATTSVETDVGVLTIDLKSVNARFLDVQFYLPDTFRSFERMLRDMLLQYVTRGKLECRLSLAREKRSAVSHALNEPLLSKLVSLEKKILAHFPQAMPLSVSDLLHWQGVVMDPTVSVEVLQEQLTAAMSAAIRAFVSSRDGEGGALTVNLFEKVESMAEIIRTLTPLVPQILLQFQEKLTARMQEILGLAISLGGVPVLSRDDAGERIRQEVLLYGLRIDIAEELSRLSIHLDEVRRILGKGGQVGKRLDFLLQELNREANTLGSKSSAREVTAASLDLKLLIEQMREQVQNLE
jgi:uncharacterized protein (TIGR00255 family)